MLCVVVGILLVLSLDRVYARQEGKDDDEAFLGKSHSCWDRSGSVWKLFLVLVPCIHVLAVACLASNVSRSLWSALLFPLAGGVRTLVFQILGWTLFCTSALLGSGTKIQNCKMANGEPVHDLVMASAVFTASMSLAFVIKSVLLFEPSAMVGTPEAMLPRRRNFGARILVPIVQKLDHAVAVTKWDVSCLPSKLAASYIVVSMGLMWGLAGLALLLAHPLHGGLKAPLGILCYAFAGICFIVAAFTIHGLGGLLRYWDARNYNRVSERNSTTKDLCIGKMSPRSAIDIKDQYATGKLSEDDESLSDRSPMSGMQRSDFEWKFYQPFQGGFVFVASQATGWVLFSLALVALFWAIGVALVNTAELAIKIQSWCVAAGMTALAAEIVLAFSLLWFNARGLQRSDLRMLQESTISVLNHVACICILYIPMHLTLAIFMLSFLILPPASALLLWAGLLPSYFLATGLGMAEKDGSREWPRFQSWLGRQVERVLPQWFGSFIVHAEDASMFSAEEKYVFCYAPHGLYPLGAAYLPITPSFKSILPGIKPATLSASIVFQIPIMRDLLLWTGLRVVSRSTFARTLRTRRSVIVVPGGQAELIHVHKLRKNSGKINGDLDKEPGECVFYSGHKGFVRLALQEKANLVPIVVFGEVTSLKNIVDAPKLLQWTYKKFGFPFPFVACGKAGILPFPSKEGLKFVIGNPIKPIELMGDIPTEEEVANQHRIFYQELVALWDKHKSTFQGYEEVPAVLVQ